MAKSGLKWTKMATNDQTWHKSLKNDIQNHLHWISASLAVIWVALWLVCDNFEFVANNFEFVAKIGQIRPQMTKNDIKVWKVISEIICIGFLLLLRSFWVVIWPVYINFEFGAKLAKKWPKKAPNDQKWPENLKSDIRNHPHWISASLAVILSGHMTSLRQFWIWGQKWTKMAEKGSKWPKKA